MLSFFRKYQRYFFMFITVVIVISFSFFGTYKTLQAPVVKNEIAFRAVDGSDITQSELSEMTLFLAADPEEGSAFSEKRSLRFLNDAVFRKEIIATGLGNVLAAAFPSEIEGELFARGAKEQAFKPYVHPEASFISAENAWSNFAPPLKGAFDLLQKAKEPTSKEAFAARTRLYLAEKQFPPTFLRQVFKYQEKQFSWLTPDENIDRLDFSLFGYHSAEDWFGPRFMSLAAQFVINSAKIAEQRGYQVSLGEAAADLHENANLAFEKILKQNPYMAGLTSADEFLGEQLRGMGLDQSRAVKIWRNVLLFKKLFQDAGASVFVDLLPFKTFTDYTAESAKGELYQLPAGLQLGNFKQLQNFELYLNAISKGYKQDSIALPQEFAAASEVAKKYPELVEKRYLLEVSSLDRPQLNAKVSLKEIWNWETDSANWSSLTKEFPELAVKKSETRQEKFAALDALTPQRRSSVDAFSQKAIVASHPEWIAELLKKETPQSMAVAIPYKGEGSPIRGLTDGLALIALLDKAPLSGKDGGDSVALEKLSSYTADGNHYYMIKVLERLPEPEVISFAEASQRGALDALLTKELEKYYLSEREKTPADFQKDDKSWKPFQEVREVLAERYFKPILTAIKEQQHADLSPTNAAPKRLLPHVETAKRALQQDLLAKDQYIQSEPGNEVLSKLAPAPRLNEQWKLIVKPFEIARKQANAEVDPTLALGLADGAWSDIHSTPGGGISFFQKQVNARDDASKSIFESVSKTRNLFFNEVQVALATDLVGVFKEKSAMSLSTPGSLLNEPEMTSETAFEE